MHLKRVRSLFILSAVLAVAGLQVAAFSTGPVPGRSGAPGELTCQNGSCHNSFDLNSGPAQTFITSSVPAGGYAPGDTYEIKIKAAQPDIQRFGFQATLLGTTSQNSEGSLIRTDNLRTQIVTQGSRAYIEHTSGGIDQTDSAVWKFNWKAPVKGTGEVKVYAAFNVSNNDGTRSGDYIYTNSLTITEGAAASLRQLPGLRNWFAAALPGSILRVHADLVHPEALEIEVLDLQGRSVYREARSASIGSLELDIPFSQHPAGLYFVRLSSRGESAMAKVQMR